LKDSLVCMTLFDCIDSHKEWLDKLQVIQEFSVTVGIQGSSIEVKGQMSKLRVIVALPTLERALKFMNIVLPLLEKMNK